MADVRISQLPAASTLTSADTFPVVQGGVTKVATISLIPSDGIEYTQASAASTWGPISHPFGRRPNVTVYDTSGNQIAPDINSSTLAVSLIFATPTAGTAVLT